MFLASDSSEESNRSTRQQTIARKGKQKPRHRQSVKNRTQAPRHQSLPFFQKKKKKFKQTKKADPNFELPNMISLLCTFHPSLNYSNIFELTVGQIRDTFSQLLRAKQLNIAEMNYSVWGGKYDPSKWIERIDKENETIGG